MPYSHKVFGRTVKKKCWSVRLVLFWEQLNCCEARKVDDDDDNDDGISISALVLAQKRIGSVADQ
jgi:hypothetical protein